MWELIIGAITTLLGSVFGNTIAGQREETARTRNYQIGELQAQNADQRTRQLYSDLYSPKAQVAQLKSAGLSPSLMYGAGTGVSGQSGAMSQAGSVMPNVFGLEAQQIAQTKLALAEAKKAEAEADRISGKGKMGEADLASIYNSIGLQDSVKRLNDIQGDMLEIDKLIKGETSKETIEAIKDNARYAKNNADYMFHKANGEYWNTEYMKETFQTRIDIAKQELANLQKEYLFKISQTKLNEAQKQKIGVEMEMIYEQLFYYDITDINSKEAYTKWMNKQAETLEEQLKLKAQELGINTTNMWLDFGSDLFKTTVQGIGLIFMGKGGNGKMPMPYNETYTPYNPYGTSGAQNYNPHKVQNWWH